MPVNRRLAAAAGPANPPAEMILATAKLGQPATDGAAGHGGRRAYRLDTATTGRQRLARRNQPTTPLVKERRDGLKPRLDGGDVNHLIKIPTPLLPEHLYVDSFIAFFP